MSFLSSAVTKRRLALFCVRLLVQYVMMCSIQQVGNDEIGMKGIRVADAASAQSIARNGDEKRHKSQGEQRRVSALPTVLSSVLPGDDGHASAFAR